MTNMRIIVMDFPSHRSWAEGYQRWTKNHSDIYQVRLTLVSGEKWKFRMLSGAATSIDDSHNEDDDIIIVDGMFDAAVVKARSGHRKVLVYLHENQLTTPYSSQDRDQKKQTSWHFGMVHYRSLLAADGFIFNSFTQLRDFQSALPRMLKEQCPPDEIDWHLEKCHQLFSSKCTFLHNGLELDDLMRFSLDENGTKATGIHTAPIILWNARLEEYKDPGSFLEMLKLVRKESNISFQLLILGTDPTKDQRWYKKFRDEVGDEQMVFMGWFTDRKEYAKYLRLADIVVSTARHETFGISIVESVFCGALPLLPNRLSYPELFPPSTFGADHLYEHPLQDGVTKLISLLQIVTTRPDIAKAMQCKAKEAVARFRWESMGPLYNRVWSSILGGEPIGAVMDNEPILTNKEHFPFDEKVIEITDASDPRVQLYRPKSLRNHALYHQQLEALQIAPVLHGGRRAMVRMVEAIQLGANIRPLSFLTTRALAQYIEHGSSTQVPIYTVDNIRLLNEIRGQSLNSGDAILSMIQFPMACPLETIRPPVLILSQVRNAENVGSLLRTAYCLGTIQSVLCGDATCWAAVRDSRAARCSMGTVFYHNYYRTDDLPATLLQLRQDHGICVYGIEINERAVPLEHHADHDGVNDGKWAMVMGNEDAGLSVEVEAACDKILYIPQAHGDSLNVGHAAAIAMYELGKGSLSQPLVSHDGRGACP
jgi:tRNA G18 (ribose-2'-O)-methylase SpoU/glycosyltransferase involved in cell wall biosynthesis